MGIRSCGCACIYIASAFTLYVYVVIQFYPLVQFQFSFVLYSLSYITIHQNKGKYQTVPREKLNHNISMFKMCFAIQLRGGFRYRHVKAQGK